MRYCFPPPYMQFSEAVLPVQIALREQSALHVADKEGLDFVPKFLCVGCPGPCDFLSEPAVYEEIDDYELRIELSDSLIILQILTLPVRVTMS